MNNTNKSTLQTLTLPIIKFAVGLIILLIIRYIVSSLPMVRDAEIVEFPLTPLQIALAVVDTIIIVIILNFGREMGNSFRLTVGRFPEVGTLTNMVVILVAISIAYKVYDDIGYTFIRGDNRWIYPVIFLAIAIIPLYLLIVTFYRNIDKLTGVTVRGIEIATKASNVCSHCGGRLPASAQFCPNCGQQVVREEVAEQVCSNCGAAIEANTKFCPQCGAAITIEPTVTATAPTPSEGVDEPVKCPNCGAVVEKDAKFCEECGARLTA